MNVQPMNRRLRGGRAAPALTITGAGSRTGVSPSTTTAADAIRLAWLLLLAGKRSDAAT